MIVVFVSFFFRVVECKACVAFLGLPCLAPLQFQYAHAEKLRLIFQIGISQAVWGPAFPGVWLSCLSQAEKGGRGEVGMRFFGEPKHKNQQKRHAMWPLAFTKYLHTYSLFLDRSSNAKGRIHINQNGPRVRLSVVGAVLRESAREWSGRKGRAPPASQSEEQMPLFVSRPHSFSHTVACLCGCCGGMALLFDQLLLATPSTFNQV